MSTWHTDTHLQLWPWTSLDHKTKMLLSKTLFSGANHKKKNSEWARVQLIQVGLHVPLQSLTRRVISDILLGSFRSLVFYADFWKVRDRLQSHQFAMERSSHTTKEIEPITLASLCGSCSGYPSLQCWNSCRGTGNADVTSRWVATKYDQPISGWCLQLTTG